MNGKKYIMKPKTKKEKWLKIERIKMTSKMCPHYLKSIKKQKTNDKISEILEKKKKELKEIKLASNILIIILYFITNFTP